MIININSEQFISGKYRGESVWDVADEDLEYLQRLLDDVPLNKSERELISQVLEIEIDE
jgi:hypothetical protein